ncbi:hypothetical protein GGS20DRAFT_554173 [Poronia punctata]|nr:hypothetical protein GGS20DRAFT_554173 [Poronia punctata]
MSSGQTFAGEGCKELATVRERLGRPVNKGKISPLLLALTVRDVDIMGRRLDSLIKEMDSIKQRLTKAPKKEKSHAAVLSRIDRLEADRRSTKDVLEQCQELDLPTQVGQDQLGSQLMDMIEQYSAAAAEQKQRFESLQPMLVAMLGKPADRGWVEVEDQCIEEHKVTNLPRRLCNRVGELLPSDTRVDPAIAEFVVTFNRFSDIYKSQKPESEAEFIRKFLGSVNVHASCSLQRRLLSHYHRSSKVSLMPLGTGGLCESYPTVFIEPNAIDWYSVKRVLKSRSLSFIRTAIDEKLCGPPPELIKRTRHIDIPGKLGPCTGVGMPRYDTRSGDGRKDIGKHTLSTHDREAPPKKKIRA